MFTVYSPQQLKNWTQSQCPPKADQLNILWCVHTCSVVSDSLRPFGLWPTRLLLSMGFFQARIVE